MARYILVDNTTSRICGDTADLADWSNSDQTPKTAARLLDESIGAGGLEYKELGGNPRDNSDVYHVYRANVRDSEVMPGLTDGQGRQAIEAVKRDCEYVSYVRCTTTD